MTEFAVKAPTMPIPFHRLLKIVALVDGEDPETRRLLDHIRGEGFEIELSDRYDRDVSEDAGVGAYIAPGRRRAPERARTPGRGGAGDGFRTPLWALADSHRISDMAVLG